MKKRFLLILTLICLVLFISACEENIVGKRIFRIEKANESYEVVEESPKVYEESKRLEQITPTSPQTTGNVVRFRNDFMMLINDEPFFPLITFHNPGLAAEGSFNTQHEFFCSDYRWHNYERAMNALTQSEELNLKNVNFAQLIKHPEVDMDFFNNISAAGALDSPAFIVYGEYDEPVWRRDRWDIIPDDIKAYVNVTLEQALDNYAILKQLDPDHPIWMDFAYADFYGNLTRWQGNASRWSRAADIVGTHVYVPATPIPCTVNDTKCVVENPEISVVGDLIDVLREAVPDKPIWMGLKGFSINPSGPLFTRKTMRFQPYQAILHGATGLYWYSDCNWLLIPNVVSVIQELSQITDLLVLEKVDVDITTTEGILTMIKDTGDNYAIIAINELNTSTVADFDLSVLNIDDNNSAYVMFEDHRFIGIENEQFSDSFEDFDVHIYQLVNCSVEEVKICGEIFDECLYAGQIICGDVIGYELECNADFGAACPETVAPVLCDSLTDCVINGICYSDGDFANTHDESIDLEICDSQVWHDIDERETYCNQSGFIFETNESQCNTGSICDDYDGSGEFCCGDDDLEVYCDGCGGELNVHCGEIFLSCQNIFQQTCCIEPGSYVLQCDASSGASCNNNNDICCNNPLDCVYANRCYEEGSFVDTLDSKNDLEICSGHSWHDPDENEIFCTSQGHEFLYEESKCLKTNGCDDYDYLGEFCCGDDNEILFEGYCYKTGSNPDQINSKFINFPSLPMTTLGHYLSSPRVADLDNDGELEIVVHSKDFKLYAWEKTGMLMEGWPQDVTGDFSYQYFVASSPAISDLDNDGSLEIIVGSEGEGVFVFENNGSLKEGWPQAIGEVIKPSPAIGDLDRDGYNDIIVGGWRHNMYAWHHNGTFLEGWPIELPLADQMISSPAIADLNNDGYLEVITGTLGKNVYVWHHNGTNVSGWPQSTNDAIESSPVVADLDGDGLLEVIVGSKDHFLYVWHSNGTIMDGWPKDNEDQIMSSPAIADLDNDGDLEIIVVTRSNHNVTVWHHDGAIMEGWPQKLHSTCSDTWYIEPSPAVADLDNDGKQEIIICVCSKCSTYNYNGTNFTSWPVDRDGYGYSSPTIADLDEDGDYEILVGRDGELEIWTTKDNLQGGKTEWPMFRHDKKNTGTFSEYGVCMSMLGDLNRNGCLEKEDIAEIMFILYSGGDPNPCADVDQNGFIEIEDVYALGDLLDSCRDCTPVNTCVIENPPTYCDPDDFELYNDCQQCGCNEGYSCQADGTCKTKPQSGSPIFRKVPRKPIEPEYEKEKPTQPAIQEPKNLTKERIIVGRRSREETTILDALTDFINFITSYFK